MHGSEGTGGKKDGVGSGDSWNQEGSHDVGNSTFGVFECGGGVWRRELDDWLNASSHDSGDPTPEVPGNEGGVVWKMGTSLYIG